MLLSLEGIFWVVLGDMITMPLGQIVVAEVSFICSFFCIDIVSQTRSHRMHEDGWLLFFSPNFGVTLRVTWWTLFHLARP